jgi:hypothetical protein
MSPEARLASAIERAMTVFPRGSEQVRLFRDVVKIALEFRERAESAADTARRLHALTDNIIPQWKRDDAAARDKARARRGRATAGAKSARTRAPDRERRDKRLERLLDRLHLDEDGRRRSNTELVELLRDEHDENVGRGKVAQLRPK